MKKLLFALLLLAGPAVAQPVTTPSIVGATGAYNASAPTCTDGEPCWVQVDAAGNLKTVASPSSSTASGITTVVSAAAEGSNVLKATPGNLYGLYVTSGASAGYLMVFNATSAPADGAVTPKHCIVVAANTTVAINNGDIPDIYSTGIVAVFSTTGCFTKTVSATAFFSGRVK